MAMSHLHRRSGSSMRRQVVREFTIREVDPSTITSGTAGFASQDDSQHVSKPLPTSVKALAGVIAVFGVVLIGIAVWRIGVWRRNKMRSRMAASQRMSKYISEKPANAIQVNFDAMVSEEKKAPFFTMPALLSRPEPAHANNKAVKKGTNRFLGGLHTAVKKSSVPPPSESPVPPPPPPKPPVVPPVPAPNVTVIRANSGKSSKSGKIELRVDVNAQTPVTGHALALQLLTANSAKRATQAPSPRSTSQGDSAFRTPATSRPKSTKSLNGKKLPRLMVVTCTFIPSLPDELLLRVGETLRMIEEYEDEWCLVQRVGKQDADKGVIPRFCLQERPDVLSRPTHTKGMSSVNSATMTPFTPATALRA